MTTSTTGSLPHPERGQFLRVEKFSIAAPARKQGGNTIDKVANEALRAPGFCPHVANPIAPVVHYGVGPLQAAQRAKEWARKQYSDYLHKQSQTVKSRKFRDDRPSALVGIISTPPEWVLGERWNDFTAACVDWLKERYSQDRLTSVLEHRDEPCLHLHFWVVPLPSESFSSVHHGQRAIDQVGRGASKTVRDAAYKKAMAKLLDDFHRDVGIHFGFARETVGGRRKSRQQWQRDKWLNEQRELEIQHRIESSVAAAIQNFTEHQALSVALNEDYTKQSELLLSLQDSSNAGFKAPTGTTPIESIESNGNEALAMLGADFQCYQFPIVKDTSLATATIERSGKPKLGDDKDKSRWVVSRQR